MTAKKKKLPYLLIISGPTASGKTSLSEKIAEHCSGEIINSDVGQFYKPLSVGTAKPDWENNKIPHHLFDIIDTPKDLTVFEYKKLVLQKANEIWNKGKLPIIVGGSLFYIKSLYFPASIGSAGSDKKNIEEDLCLDDKLWDKLNRIDPKRAGMLHPNDIYRIKRALYIWETTGIKPSEHKPPFSPEFNSVFIFINLDRTFLYKRIDQRTVEMIKKEGWIDEAKKFLKTKWESFIIKKGLIGYSDIFDWINKTENKSELTDTISNIQQKTRQYAKKQFSFWRSFKKQLIEESQKKSYPSCNVIEINSLENKNINNLLKQVPALLSLKN